MVPRMRSFRWITHFVPKVFWMRQEGRCDKEIIFQADHTYSAGPQRELLLQRTRDWLNEQENIQQEWQHWMI